MKDWDKELFKTLQDSEGKTATDKQFVKNLAEWIFELSGNVNVTQRLNTIAIRLRK